MRQYFSILFLIVYSLSFSQTTQSDCTENLTLSNFENNSNITYNAQNSIVTESNYEVSPANNKIEMKAGNGIVLKANTHIKRGSLYLARIESCELCELNFITPNFFTPNGDGYNDSWKTNWFNPNKFLKLSIFDRYGKLIKTLGSPYDSWNGKYNSNDLPASDYWFKIIYKDCNENIKEYISHFSLKR